MLIETSPAQVEAASCNAYPNYYAAGTDTGTNEYYGVQGYIQAHSESVPNNGSTTDEHILVLANSRSSSAKGLELGWLVGSEPNTGQYVTTPHLYLTFNGPHEVNGPAISTSSDYYYAEWTDSSDVAHFQVRTGPSGTVVWGNQYSYPGTPGGQALAMGEVTVTTATPMGPSTLSDLQHLNGAGQWFNWPGMTTCADSPYQVTGHGTNWLSNDG